MASLLAVGFEMVGFVTVVTMIGCALERYLNRRPNA